MTRWNFESLVKSLFIKNPYSINAKSNEKLIFELLRDESVTIFTFTTKIMRKLFKNLTRGIKCKLNDHAATAFEDH